MKIGLSFSERLEKILLESDYRKSIYDDESGHMEGHDNYITPDDIYIRSYNPDNKDDRVTFIYNPDGLIFYGQGDMTHSDIIRENYEYYKIGYDIDIADTYGMYKFLEDTILLGRCGTMQHKDDKNRFEHYVAFWNTGTEIYVALLEPCLQQLEKDGYITQDTLLSIPHMGITKLNDKSGETKRQIGTLSDEQLEKIKLQRELHLMRPEQKKAAMLKLGLSPYGKKNEWQKGSEETDLVKPGQKWWATTSENKRSKDFI